MSSGNATNSPSAVSRVGLWLFCCLIPVVCLCWILGTGGSIGVALRIALLFFLPVWVAYLPLVLKLKDAEHQRLWLHLGAGTFTGPFLIALWCVIQLLQGEHARTLWQGDADGPDMPTLLIGSSILTLALSAIYAVSLRALCRERKVAVSSTGSSHNHP